MTASDILTTITLGVSAWTLCKVISQGETIAAIRQKLKDLPCDKCSK